MKKSYSKKKQKKIVEFSDDELSVPMTIFANRKLTILESHSGIAKILKKTKEISGQFIQGQREK